MFIIMFSLINDDTYKYMEFLNTMMNKTQCLSFFFMIIMFIHHGNGRIKFWYHKIYPLVN